VGDLHGRHVARGVVALPIHDSYIVPRVSKNCAKTRLPGWGGRTRTSASGMVRDWAYRYRATQRVAADRAPTRSQQ